MLIPYSVRVSSTVSTLRSVEEKQKVRVPYCSASVAIKRRNALLDSCAAVAQSDNENACDQDVAHNAYPDTNLDHPLDHEIR